MCLQKRTLTFSFQRRDNSVGDYRPFLADLPHRFSGVLLHPSKKVRDYSTQKSCEPVVLSMQLQRKIWSGNRRGVEWEWNVLCVSVCVGKGEGSGGSLWGEVEEGIKFFGGAGGEEGGEGAYELNWEGGHWPQQPLPKNKSSAQLLLSLIVSYFHLNFCTSEGYFHSRQYAAWQTNGRSGAM